MFSGDSTGQEKSVIYASRYASINRIIEFPAA